MTVALSVPAIYGAMHYTLGDLRTPIGGGTFSGMDLFECALVGLAVTGLLVVITEYYTGTNFRPVRSIAKASETGHGTNVIQRSEERRVGKEGVSTCRSRWSTNH